MHWYLGAFKKYFQFSGRARRLEYWIFFLVHSVVTLLLTVVDALFNTMVDDVGLIGLAYALVSLIPYLSLTIRRYHDAGFSGWWVLAPGLAVIPLIAGAIFSSKALLLLALLMAIGLVIFQFVLTVLSGTTGENEYGSDPKVES